MTKFAYNNARYLNLNIFFYYLKIRYKIENNFKIKRVLFAKQRIKYFDNIRNTLI